MGYGVRAYVVDIGKLTGAIGGGNRDLLGAVAASCADLIEDFDYLANEQGAGDDRGGLHRMIANLIDGDFRGLDEAEGLGRAGLGYALECLAAHLSGGPLITIAVKNLTDDWLRDQPVLRELTGRPGPLAGRVPMPEDFPAICVVGNEETNPMLRALQRARDTNRDPTSRACYDEFMVWLETARAEGKGLISFLY